LYAPSREGNAGTVGREEVEGDLQSGGVDAVLRRQKPARQPAAHLMQAIAQAKLLAALYPAERNDLA